MAKPAASKAKAKWKWRGDHEQVLSLGVLILAHIHGTEERGYNAYLNSSLPGVPYRGTVRTSIKSRAEAQRRMEQEAMEWLHKTGLGKFVSMPGGETGVVKPNVLSVGRRIALGPKAPQMEDA